MKRRSFIGALFSSTVLLIACGPKKLVDCLSNKDSVLKNMGQFADRVLGKAAASRQLPSLQQSALGQQLCAGDVVEQFRRQVALDFTQGRTLKLDGWIVSETEALIHRAAYLAGEPQADEPKP